MELLKKVRVTIEKHSMLSDGDSVLVGLSGGPDSVCLAVILDKLKKDLDLSLNAVYIDHGLRPDEVEDEKAFCKDLCEKLGFGFFTRAIDVKKHSEDERMNLQEAARELRYRVFEEVSSEVNATKIALGHNADDQAETFLMRILRGSGYKGLSAIPPVRGRIIRPLIEADRADIEEFLDDNPSQSFMTDSSNLKTDYFRNWLRQKIMPELKDQNPSLVKTIGRAADIIREEDAYLEIVVTKTLMKLISRKSDDTIELFLVPLETMAKPILRRVLRRVINETNGLRGIEYVHIEDVVNLIKNGKPGNRLYLPKGVRVIKEYALMVLTSKPPVVLSKYELAPPGEVVMREAGLVLSASFDGGKEEKGNGSSAVLLDASKMSFPLKIRARAEGDFFFPLGFGKKKKLQDFFVDEKVPRDERDRVPVVLSGDDIVWIAGYRADDRFKVTDRTEKFLRLIISKGKRN